MSKNSEKNYQFTIQNNIVTGVFEIKNGRIKLEKMDSDEQWSYDATTKQVTKTENEHGRLQTTVYTDTDGDGAFSQLNNAYGILSSTSTLTPTNSNNGYTYQHSLKNGCVDLLGSANKKPNETFFKPKIFENSSH